MLLPAGLCPRSFIRPVTALKMPLLRGREWVKRGNRGAMEGRGEEECPGPQ